MSKESKAMSYEQIVQAVKQRFSGTDVSRITDHLAYQFNITGEGAGSFYVEVKEGKLVYRALRVFRQGCGIHL